MSADLTWDMSPEEVEASLNRQDVADYLATNSIENSGANLNSTGLDAEDQELLQLFGFSSTGLSSSPSSQSSRTLTYNGFHPHKTALLQATDWDTAMELLKQGGSHMAASTTNLQDYGQTGSPSSTGPVPGFHGTSRSNADHIASAHPSYTQLMTTQQRAAHIGQNFHQQNYATQSLQDDDTDFGAGRDRSKQSNEMPARAGRAAPNVVTASSFSKRKAPDQPHTQSKKPRTAPIAASETSTQDVMKLFAEDSAASGSTSQYQDVFYSEEDSTKRLNRDGVAISYYALKVPNDDADRFDDNTRQLARKAFYNAILHPPMEAPSDLDENTRQRLNKKHNQRFVKVREMMVHHENHLDASACVDNLIHKVVSLHAKGIPVGDIKLSHFTEEEINAGNFRRRVLKLEHCGLKVDQESPCITRLASMLHFLKVNKYVAYDLLKSRGGFDAFAFAAAPEAYNKLKMTNWLGNTKKARVLEAFSASMKRDGSPANAGGRRDERDDESEALDDEGD